MTHRIGSKGQVVIPKQLRESTGMEPGVKVEFEATERGVLIRPAETDFAELRGMFRDLNLAESLLEDRAREPK